MSTQTEPQTDKIEIRTTRSQKQLIEQAAQAEGVNVKSFIISRIFPEAQRILADRSLFVLNEVAWSNFNNILDRPIKENPKLKELLNNPSVLEQRRIASGRNRKH